MDETLLKEIAQDIGVTKGIVKGIKKQLDDVKKEQDNQDTRLRRVENIFLPVVFAFGIFGNKILEYMGLR
ncbi:hypothetical protein KA005_32745 [bacterium]|nr:hypothetical protein [bacterium]